MPPVWVTPLICALAILGLTIQIWRSRKQSLESRDLVNRNSAITTTDGNNQIHQLKFEPWDKTGRWARVAQIASYILLAYGSYLISSGIYTAIKTTDYQGTISGAAQILGGIATVLLWKTLLLPVRAVVNDSEVDAVDDLKKRRKQQVQSAMSHGASAVKDSKDAMEKGHDVAGNNVDGIAAATDHGTKGQRAVAAGVGVGIGIASVSGAIGLAITIASVAITTIATSVPGVMSPLGGLPPTTANLATHFDISFSGVNNGGVDTTTLNENNGTNTGNNSPSGINTIATNNTSTSGVNTTTTNNNNGALGTCICTKNCVDALVDFNNQHVQAAATNSSFCISDPGDKCRIAISQTDYMQQCVKKYLSGQVTSGSFYNDNGVIDMKNPACTNSELGGCLASLLISEMSCCGYPKTQQAAGLCCGLILQ
ncbi:hypothetical protein HDU76_002361 [Blyttiomyces sp. JEL0837]|nr:hypothetical protein HDU76_002361 [Blyttiomyces sp. JEL0837]